MACSLKTVIGFGIVIAIIDILHGFTTIGFYGYQFMLNYFFLCPREIQIDDCHNERYIYDQRFKLRTIIGLGEGGVTLFFDIFVIICFAKRQACMSWLWLFKSFSVIGIHVFYISAWVLQNNQFKHINTEPQPYEYHFLIVGIVLALVQVGIMILFCIIFGIFTCKLSAERSFSRRNLHPRNSKFKKNASPSAPPAHSYDDDDIASYMNPALNDSTNKLPYPGSNGSLDQISNSETMKQPTAV